MKETYDSEKTKKLSLELPEQVALDLANYLDNFPNKTFAIRILANESGLNQKTIRRLLACENNPTYQTLFRLYSIFLEDNNLESLTEKCPEVVAQKIKDYNPCGEEVEDSSAVNLLEMFKKEPLLSEIYILSTVGPINRNALAFRYGQYGLEVLDRLVESELLQEIERDTFTVSKNCPDVNGECLKFLGEHFSHRFAKPGNSELHDQNIISFYAEGLSKEGMKEWLKVDTEAFYKKLEISKNPKFKGDIPVFTYTTTDTISTEKKS